MENLDKLIQQLRKLDTEQVNPETVDIDRLDALAITRKINREDRKVAAIVEQQLDKIAVVAELFAKTIRNRGRIFYVGAGTSGRLGVLDAAECPPTFGTDPEQVIGLIAGGYAALVLSLEGKEDDRRAAEEDLKQRNLSEKDLVIGICASQRTPYTLSALGYASSIGCRTAFIICNRSVQLDVNPDILIELPVGPEVITGSTRMKSGSAQKMALNMISTTAMVLLGKTYGNLMIDLQAKSEKLAARSRKILMDLFDLSLDRASNLLKEADGSVKVAMVMHRFQCQKDQALEKLHQADGFFSRIR